MPSPSSMSALYLHVNEHPDWSANILDLHGLQTPMWPDIDQSLLASVLHVPHFIEAQ